MSFRVLVAAMFALCALAAGSAEAQGPRCAVVPFDGGSEVVLTRSFLRALGDNGFVTVVPEDEVEAVARDGGAAEVARAVGAELVIEGTTSGTRRSRRLEVVAYDAGGRELARQGIPVRSGGAGRRALDEGISELLAAALPALASSAPAAEPTVEAEADAVEVAAASSAPAASTGTAPPRDAGELGPSPPTFAVRLGVVTRTRDAEALLTAGSPRSWRSEPVYVELYAGLELRPLATSRDLARGLYLRAEFANAVGLGSRDPLGREVFTHFFRAAGDVGYLLPAGEVVEVGGGVGFGWDAYLLGANPNFPTVELPHVRPHLRSRLRLWRELAVVGLEAGLRVTVDRGALSAAFGGGDTLGFDVGASVGGTFDFGLTYLVEVRWAGDWHRFAASGALGDGVSGVEHGLRCLVAVGYAIP